MNVFGRIKNALKREEPAPAEQVQPVETSLAEANQEKAGESSKAIIKAIDELLGEIGDSTSYPNLGTEGLSRVSERLSRIQIALNGSHSDYDVSELDANILALVSSLGGQMKNADEEKWTPILDTLNSAIRSRIISEQRIREASLDVAECLIKQTNEAWESEKAFLEEKVKTVTEELLKTDYSLQLMAVKKNLLLNEQRLEEIANSRLQLTTLSSGLSPEILQSIDRQLTDIMTELPASVKALSASIESIRKKEIAKKDRIDDMVEIINKFDDAVPESMQQADGEKTTQETAQEASAATNNKETITEA